LVVEEEAWTQSPREWIDDEVVLELRDRRLGDVAAGHDSIAGVLGSVNELGVTIEELYADDAGEAIRIASFVPWAAIRRIMLRA
jgi:hypothetical protein